MRSQSAVTCSEQKRIDLLAGRGLLEATDHRALPAVLRGERDPLSLLFGGTEASAEDIYRESPVSRLLNSMLAEAARISAAPGGVSRVLEVGAGTGASTEWLLRAFHHETEYWFTDVSPSLVDRAKKAYPGLRHRVLDISKPPNAPSTPTATVSNTGIGIIQLSYSATKNR